MTHEELIEKVDKALCDIEGMKYGELKPLAKVAIATILIALQEPTNGMISAGILAYDGKCETSFIAMLNASPLAGEKRGAE